MNKLVLHVVSCGRPAREVLTVVNLYIVSLYEICLAS